MSKTPIDRIYRIRSKASRTNTLFLVFGLILSITTYLDGIPREHVRRAVEREEPALQRGQHVLGAGRGRPALGAVDAPQRAGLAHQEDLVLARREHLAGHVPRRVAQEKHRERRVVLGGDLLALLDAL